VPSASSDRPAILLDLDGTLTDSVYQHALAWRKALEVGGITLSVWRIHRRIGMSGGLLAESLARETGRELTPDSFGHKCATCGYSPARKT
jgi:beta-phosphoglucomutase-like phosphatase (HAD superfamily)